MRAWPWTWPYSYITPYGPQFLFSSFETLFAPVIFAVAIVAILYINTVGASGEVKQVINGHILYERSVSGFFFTFG